MKSLSTYSKKRFELLSEYLIAFGNTPEAEFIHKIRLEIKKIKALLQVTGFCIKGFKGHKRYVPLRSIFRKAGEIRGKDVLSELFPKQKTGKRQKKITETPNRYAGLVSAFQDSIPVYISNILQEEEKISRSVKKVKSACFKKYLKLKKTELKFRLFPRFKPRELHKTRKVLKEILYLSSVDVTITKKSAPFYDETQLLIGQWHDKQMLLPVLKKSGDAGEVTRLKAECRQDISSIRKKVSQFYNS